MSIIRAYLITARVTRLAVHNTSMLNIRGGHAYSVLLFSGGSTLLHSELDSFILPLATNHVLQASRRCKIVNAACSLDCVFSAFRVRFYSFLFCTLSTIVPVVCDCIIGCYASVLMDRSSVLRPSYLRRPDSYDRLGVHSYYSHPHSQRRFLADRLLVSGTSTAAGKALSTRATRPTVADFGDL